MASKSNSNKSMEDYCVDTMAELNKLRLSNEYCDIEIRVKNTVFQAHKVVLAAGSKYFQAMFSFGPQASTLKSTTLESVEPEIFEKLLTFMYTGRLSPTENDAVELLVAAEMFSLVRASDVCCDYFKLNMQISNCTEIYEMSDAYNLTNLRNCVLNFICLNFKKINPDQCLVSLNKDLFLDLIKRQELEVTQEGDVLEAVIKWIRYKEDERVVFTEELLHQVRFPLVSDRMLNRCINSCDKEALRELIRKFSEDCRTFFYGKTDLPSHLWRHRNSMRRSLYLVGGYRIDSQARESVNVECLEVYHPDISNWTINSKTIVSERSHLGVVSLKGCVYAVGGESQSLLQDCVEVFDPFTKGQCIQVAPLLRPRSMLSACTVQDKIYVFGGWIGENMADTIEMYDPTRNEWTDIATMEIKMHGAGIAVYKDIVYLVGGMDPHSGLSSLYSFDPYNLTWTKLRSMKEERGFPAAVVFEDELYVIGGDSSNCDTVLDTVEKYNFETNEWSYAPSIRTPRFGHSAAVLNGKIVVCGGSRWSRQFGVPQTEILATCELYPSMMGRWQEFPSLQIGRSDAGVAVI